MNCTNRVTEFSPEKIPTPSAPPSKQKRRPTIEKEPMHKIHPYKLVLNSRFQFTNGYRQPYYKEMYCVEQKPICKQLLSNGNSACRYRK